MSYSQAAIESPLRLLAALLVCLLPAACHADPSVRIAGVTYLGDLPTLIAEQHNLFQNQGINAHVDYGPSGKVNLEKLREGEVDYALMALTPLVIDRLSDSTPGESDDPVILASLVHSTRLNQVVTVAGRGIESASDLVARRVALNRGTNAEFVWWLFAHYHAFDPDAIALIDRPISQIPQALLNQEIDVAVVWEPWTTRLHERLGDQLQIFPHSNIYTAKWVVVTTRRTAEQYARRSSRVLAAYQAAIEYIEHQTEQALNLYAEHVELSRSALPSLEQSLDFRLGLDWSLISTLQQQFAWARQAGYSDNDAMPEILPLIDSRPLQMLTPRLVGIPVNADNE